MARMAEGVGSFFLSGSSSMLLQSLVLPEFQKDKTEDMGPFDISSQIAESPAAHSWSKQVAGPAQIQGLGGDGVR